MKPHFTRLNLKSGCLLPPCMSHTAFDRAPEDQGLPTVGTRPPGGLGPRCMPESVADLQKFLGQLPAIFQQAVAKSSALGKSQGVAESSSHIACQPSRDLVHMKPGLYKPSGLTAFGSSHTWLY